MTPNPVIGDFIDRARKVRIAAIAARHGITAVHDTAGRHKEWTGPCPLQGGEDAYSVNLKENVWNCRKCGRGGYDAPTFICHAEGLDPRGRDWLTACSLALGEPIPNRPETDDEKLAREERAERRRRQAQAQAVASARADSAFRNAEIARARGKYGRGRPLTLGGHPSPAATYLMRRAGLDAAPARWLRWLAEEHYWHGLDPDGRPLSIHCGPAMVAPMVDAAGAVSGCHLTWIHPGRPPKYRPALFGLTEDGIKAGAAPWHSRYPRETPPPADMRHYRIMPAKKMRGAKAGTLIPVAGVPEKARWLGAEGIENVCAIARVDGWRDDTFYFAAGDLGNLAGKAAHESDFSHPRAIAVDRSGRRYRPRVAGPVWSGDGGHWIGGHVRELVYAADGDSERVMTASAMARAVDRARRLVPGISCHVIWPGDGDWADLLSGAA